MSVRILLPGLFLLASACNRPALLTRPSEADRTALGYGHPVDLERLADVYPVLKGRLFAAPDVADDYPDPLSELDADPIIITHKRWSGRSVEQVPFVRGHTLYQVLGGSGLGAGTDWRQIRVTRRADQTGSEGGHIIICDAWDFIVHGNERQNIPLFPGDLIQIPTRHRHDKSGALDIALAYAAGEISYQEILQAIADNGSPY